MTTQDFPAIKAIIAPSLLASDLSNLSKECERMTAAKADWLHLDVMDGHFVPNLTFGAPVIQTLRKNCPDSFLDCHLMVSKPAQWVDDFAKAGADMYTFHIESEMPEGGTLGLINSIKAKGMKCGIAVKPNTPLDDVLEYVEQVDMILIMTVEPGFGGQSFMHGMMTKVESLRKLHPNCQIQVDGGLGPSTIDTAASAGANVIVAGSSVFKSDNPTETIQQLRDAVSSKIISS